MIPEIFKRRRDIGREDKSAAGAEVFFMADFDGEGRPMMRVVGSVLKDIDLAVIRGIAAAMFGMGLVEDGRFLIKAKDIRRFSELMKIRGYLV